MFSPAIQPPSILVLSPPFSVCPAGGCHSTNPHTQRTGQSSSTKKSLQKSSLHLMDLERWKSLREVSSQCRQVEVLLHLSKIPGLEKERHRYKKKKKKNLIDDSNYFN